MARFPERVGWYELLAPIGAGGMATVYLGLAEREGGFQRHVAVKMMHGTAEGDSQLAAVLLREAKLVAKIRHPNVVSVMDVGEDPYGLYLVMDYVEGDNLSALRRAAKRAGTPIPTAIALRIVTDALAGLHAAHELVDETGANLGVVHRDFSPHNILVGTDGVSRLTDFGIAKVAYTAGHTRTGKIKGKIAYMSPEQARAQPVDRRCDVWAAGVVAWEAITGEKMYDTEDEIAALLKVVNEVPPRLASVRPDLPAELDEAIASALTPKLEDRCPTADALRRKLLAAHPVADIEEVSAFVREIVGPKLAERQQKIAEIRQLRGKLGELAAVTNEAGSSPRNPFTPLASGSAASSVALARSHSAAEIRLTELSGETDPGTSLATSGTVERFFVDRRRRAAFIGVASGLALGTLGLIALLVVISGKETDKGITALPAGGPSRPVPTPAAAKPPAPPLSATQLTDLPVEPVVAIEANAPIQSLKIGNETIPLTPPSAKPELQRRLEPGTVIEATAVDGRRARVKLPQDGGVVKLTFPKGTFLPKPRPTGGNIPFAENPYKKK